MILRNDVVFPLVAALIVFLEIPCASQDTAEAPASAQTTAQPVKTGLPTAAAKQAAPQDTKTLPQDTAAKAAAPQTAASPAPATVKDTAQKGPAPAKPATSLQKKKTVEEDIIDEELLIPEKGVAQPVKKQQPQPVKADTAAASAPVKAAAETSKAGAPATPGEVAGRASTKAPAAPVADTSIKTGVVKAPAAPAKPVKIEAARAINFAKNLKEYRSPKVAMLMSLFIPGLGQAYIKNYWRAGLYVAAEAAIIGISVVFMNKGKDKYNQATGFADGNFSSAKMKTYYNDLESWLQQKWGDDTTSIQSALGNISMDTLKSFMHACSLRTQEFYSTIKDKAYTQGWNDCQPSFAEITGSTAPDPGLQLQDQPGYQNRYYRYSDTLGLSYLINIKNKDNDALIPDGEAQYGYSADQRTYRMLMSQSNDNYKTATTVAFILLINHVVSAVDALIFANMYNDDLLGKQQSLWHHIEVAPGVAGRDMISAPGLTMRVKF